MSRLPSPVGPIERPDAKPPHPNPIRRFREELRLTRKEFADITGFNVDSLRMWESTGAEHNRQATKPNGNVAVAIVELARRNFYPLTLEDIYESEADIPKNIPFKLSAKRKRASG